MDSDVLRRAPPYLMGLLGVAAGYGGVRLQVRMNRDNIAALQNDFNVLVGNPTGTPAFVPREECARQTTEMARKINTLSIASREQGQRLTGLSNFARYVLTKQQGLTLAEVNEILGED